MYEIDYIAAAQETEALMPVILWTILAAVLVLLAVFVAAHNSRSVLPALVLPPGESLPTTRLQRSAFWALLLGIPLIVTAGGIVAWFGPTAFDEDDSVRLSVTGLLIVGLFVLAAPTLLAGIWANRGDELDERDRAILARAPAGQAAAILIVLAVWIIGLQESYRGQPGIPQVFLYLIFWSCVEVSLLASNVGILIGYRRA
jgi:hypothetical protein